MFCKSHLYLITFKIIESWGFSAKDLKFGYFLHDKFKTKYLIIINDYSIFYILLLIFNNNDDILIKMIRMIIIINNVLKRF